MDSRYPLQFGPFSSSIHPSFWSVLSKVKLEVQGLQEDPLVARGSYVNSDPVGLPASLALEWDALKDENSATTAGSSINSFPAVGKVLNKNTLESFRQCDKKALLEAEAAELWAMFADGRALERPANLCKFVVLMHADLKKFQFFYWFAFPSFILPDEVSLERPPASLGSTFSLDTCKSISELYPKYRRENPYSAGFFVLLLDGDVVRFCTLKEGIDNPGGIVGFADPWTGPENPGWPLRNVLALIYARNAQRLSNLKVISLRQGKKSFDSSLVFTVTTSVKLANCSEMPKCVGWEKNEKGQLGPQVANMKSTMDPKSLADSSVNLNLKLMKWRLVPDLNLETMASTKCLLLGSGTLGCNVARCLLGWGVRNITFVDNSKVSFSNPVRQSLFTFDDCLEGGSHKAEAAARMLRKVHPGVNAEAVDLAVPMPGHAISESLVEECRINFQRLDDLVQRHDVIFLLMDTRESRWLPTIMGAHHDKLVINSALGFDSFVVMRHGRRVKGEDTEKGDARGSHRFIGGDELGCYFCNDVVAPGNSTRDRTLDQQCTVTRPGVSYIAAALAVELMASVLQHPQGASAPAFISASNDTMGTDDGAEGLLGSVPHSIRGSIHSFHQFQPTTALFSHCTGCSTRVLEAFAKDKFEFLLKVCNGGANYLEELTELSKLMADTNLEDVLEFSDDDSTSCKSSS